jgi:aminoglycoside 6'-N-acetyltransferase
MRRALVHGQTTSSGQPCRLASRQNVSTYEFRPFTSVDLPMVARWLRTPEVIRWWGQPEEQLALVAEDLDNPLMRQWIVAYDGIPFAYAQAYAAHAWPQSHLLPLPAGAEVIDAFIGEPTMLGRGHGSSFLRALALMLIAEGASAVAIDPDSDNHRARRAYARAGFVGEEIVETKEGPAVLMVFSS